MEHGSGCSHGAEEVLSGLTPDSVRGLYDTREVPEAFADWSNEVAELTALLSALWEVCLRALVNKLVSMVKAADGDRFRDHLFEALVAKRMRDHGAVLEYESEKYGTNPVDFAVRLGNEAAFVECGCHSKDWYDVVENKVRSALRRDQACARSVDVKLWTPEPLGRDVGRDVEKRLPREVVELARGLGRESTFDGPAVDGLIIVRIRRASSSEPTSVCWDWDRPGGNWGDPKGLSCRRLLALRNKAEDKFGGMGQMGEGGFLRLLIVGWEGPHTRLRRMQDVIRGQLKSDVRGRALRGCLDALAFVRRPNERLVEDLMFEAPIAVTPDADRERRVHRFFHLLGADRGGHVGKAPYADEKRQEQDGNQQDQGSHRGV